MFETINESIGPGIGLIVPAKRTSQREFIAVGRVIASRGAVLLPAGNQFVLRYFCHVVSGTLSLVARLAEVRGVPAEPLRDLAAELALELDEFFAVLLAILHRNFTAIRTDQFLRIKLLIAVVNLSHAVFHPSKVRFLTFTA